MDIVTRDQVGAEIFSHDANGNMTLGLNGKVMTYDAENRPLMEATGWRMKRSMQ